MPSPAATLSRLFALIQQQKFWLSVGISLSKIMQGFVLALVTASILSIITARLHWVHTLLVPLLNVIKATPVASFILLVMVWAQSSNFSTVVSYVMVLPMIYTNLYQGIKNVSPQLLEVGRVFGLSHWEAIKKIYIPSIIPYLVSSCTVGLGFAWKSGVAAEVIGLPNNTIGTHLHDAKVILETADLFAWTLVIVLLSVLMENLIMLCIKLMNRKRKISY